MDELKLLIDLHLEGKRQGPGGEAETRLALQLSGIDRQAPLKIADIGCGTGASTLLLAEMPNVHVTAVDMLAEFLDVLSQRAACAGVAERITTQACSMDSLSFADNEYDILWSEGAIYNIGFENGVAQWRRFLKPDGLMVLSEITWFTPSRPAELQNYWDREYPEIASASTKLGLLEQHGYSLIGSFALPEYCWLQNYYHPLRGRFDAFLERHGNSQAAQAILSAEEREIQLYELHKAFFGYGMYVARKV